MTFETYCGGFLHSKEKRDNPAGSGAFKESGTLCFLLRQKRLENRKKCKRPAMTGQSADCAFTDSRS